LDVTPPAGFKPLRVQSPEEMAGAPRVEIAGLPAGNPFTVQTSRYVYGEGSGAYAPSLNRTATGNIVPTETMLAKIWLGDKYNSSIDPSTVWRSSGVTGSRVVISQSRPGGNGFVDSWQNPAEAIESQKAGDQAVYNYALWGNPLFIATGDIIGGVVGKVGGIALQKSGASRLIGMAADTGAGRAVTGATGRIVAFGESRPSDLIGRALNIDMTQQGRV
jgi:hypothetical protein